MIRLVKLSIKKESIQQFQEIFNASKKEIRAFDGCSFLALYHDKNNPSIFFTYSQWEDESHLNSYRNSEFFKQVWAKTKLLFDDKPEVWSVDSIASLP